MKRGQADVKMKVFGGGTGGVIQIISPVGNLSRYSLFLRNGANVPKDVTLCTKSGATEANGYYYLQGMEYNGRS